MQSVDGNNFNANENILYYQPEPRTEEKNVLMFDAMQSKVIISSEQQLSIQRLCFNARKSSNYNYKGINICN